jgi:cytochrome c
MSAAAHASPAEPRRAFRHLALGYRFSVLGIAFSLAAAMPSAAQADAALAAKIGCSTCHAEDKRRVGPSFREIAAKYGDKRGAVNSLTVTIMAGDRHPKTKGTEAEVRKVLEWILEF